MTGEHNRNRWRASSIAFAGVLSLCVGCGESEKPVVPATSTAWPPPQPLDDPFPSGPHMDIDELPVISSEIISGTADISVSENDLYKVRFTLNNVSEQKIKLHFGPTTVNTRRSGVKTLGMEQAAIDAFSDGKWRPVFDTIAGQDNWRAYIALGPEESMSGSVLFGIRASDLPLFKSGAPVALRLWSFGSYADPTWTAGKIVLPLATPMEK